MFPALDEDLHFGYQLTGSLVVARGAEDEAFLDELVERGKTNVRRSPQGPQSPGSRRVAHHGILGSAAQGVRNLRIVRGAELKQMEPNLDEAATAALLSPDAGTLIPYEYNIALAENAADNGVEVRIRRMVSKIGKTADGHFEIGTEHWEPKKYVAEQQSKEGGLAGLWSKMSNGGSAPSEGLGNYFGGGPGEGGPWDKFPALVRGEQNVKIEDMKVGGSGSIRAMDGVVVERESIRARYVVNCAGGASDKIAKMIGDDSFTIKPRLGEYVLLKKSSGGACNHILFPCPGPYGKGILVQKTLWGNLILGPTARDQHEWPDPNVDPDSKEEILQTILSNCKKLIPSFDMADTFHSFAGARAKSSRGDWIIERSAADGDMIHAAGIDSPGIAGSPAIALEVVRGRAGLTAHNWVGVIGGATLHVSYSVRVAEAINLYFAHHGDTKTAA